VSRRQTALFLGLAAVATGFALTWGVVRGTDLAVAVLTVAVLGASAATLTLVAPKPAELLVQRQDELELDDLIFYVYPQLAATGERQVPRDLLLQMHVAVINVGGRKAVLSRLRLNEFLDKDGVPVRLPEVPPPLQATLMAQQGGWVNHQYESQVRIVFPPYVLEQDDVITLRFRCRRGIDWSQRWGVEELSSYADAIARPITTAAVTAVFRRGASVQQRPFTVPVRVLQQQEFHDLLCLLTADFTIRPTVPEQPIAFE